MAQSCHCSVEQVKTSYACAESGFVATKRRAQALAPLPQHRHRLLRAILLPRAVRWSTKIHFGQHIQPNRSLMTRAARQSTGEASTALQPDMKKTKVLFVCKGNICRSPAAGSVLKKVVERSGVSADFQIDSCGTGGHAHENWYKLDHKDHWEEHEDKTVDERMIAALEKRSLDPHSISRPLEPEDFQRFDFIIAMNDGNKQEIQKAARYWKDDLKKPLPSDWQNKIQFMTNYLIKGDYQGATEVPDPFHGGPEGFEKVLDLLEDACEGLLSHVESKKFATES